MSTATMTASSGGIPGVGNSKLAMWLFLCSDAMSFGGLLVAYAILRVADPNWPVPAEVLNIPLTALNTFILICSSVSMVIALHHIQHGDRKKMVNWLFITAGGGACFLGVQAYEWYHLIHNGLDLSTGIGMTFYVLTGFHGFHVLSGVIYLAVVALIGMRGAFSADDNATVEIAGLYWHFVDLVWILIFTFVYLV